MEEEVLARWERDGIFEQSLNKPAPKGNFVFFEGPPTANGRPGIHHVEARAFKDIIPRFKTMQGYRVERKAGWDTHGLPVELEVEKKLGISGKPQIETLKETPEASITHFNALCKESVWTYVEEFRSMTRRLGYWLDLEHPYITYEPAYIESLWAITRQIWDRGLMVRDYKILPYCGRCGTALSSHEVAQGYKEVSDPSVYVRFTLESGAHLLVWTTTPWTLPANVALAVGADIPYVEVTLGNERLILAKSRLSVLEGHPYTEGRELMGKELVGQTYTPLYTLATPDAPAHRIVAGDFVSTEDGTGIVHIAPAFGEDDLRLAKDNHLPVLMTVDAEARFTFPEATDGLGAQLHGMFVKDGDALITEDLKSRGHLFAIEPYVHEYPFCWRCATPLIYYAKHSWFFAVSQVKDELMKNAEQISWTPDYIKEGRFGEWLRGIRDWAISRERYWGTPLPIWTCTTCGKQECVGSFAQLAEQATPESKPDLATFDPHRPFIDAVKLVCSCGGTMQRVPDVMDVWFDSGAMPFAQWHYPFENTDRVDPPEASSFPADYIAEAIDQTRGWFYTLLAVSTLLGRPAPYRHVVCLGHLLDAKGLKMSKSKGNVVDPFAMIAQYGADACRMYMYTVNQPGDPKRFDPNDIGLMVKQVHNMIWNMLTFYTTYPGNGAATGDAHVLDAWVKARMNAAVVSVTDDLNAYRITEAGRTLMECIDDLSTWYVRRSRNRFKAGDAHASATLRQSLMTLATLFAPFMPFLSDTVYERLGGTQQSVHLETWPTAQVTAEDTALLEEMAYTRRIVSFGLEARSDARMPIRQPLATATIHAKAVRPACVELIREELNVHEVVFVAPTIDSITVTLDTELSPALKAEGAVRELMRHIQNLRKEAGLTVQDTVVVYLMGADDELLDRLFDAAPLITSTVHASRLVREKKDGVHDAQIHLTDSAFWVGIEKVT